MNFAVSSNHVVTTIQLPLCPLSTILLDHSIDYNFQSLHHLKQASSSHVINNFQVDYARSVWRIQRDSDK